MFSTFSEREFSGRSDKRTPLNRLARTHYRESVRGCQPPRPSSLHSGRSRCPAGATGPPAVPFQWAAFSNSAAADSINSASPSRTCPTRTSCRSASAHFFSSMRAASSEYPRKGRAGLGGGGSNHQQDGRATITKRCMMASSLLEGMGNRFQLYA